MVTTSVDTYLCKLPTIAWSRCVRSLNNDVLACLKSSWIIATKTTLIDNASYSEKTALKTDSEKSFWKPPTHVSVFRSVWSKPRTVFARGVYLPFLVKFPENNYVRWHFIFNTSLHIVESHPREYYEDCGNRWRTPRRTCQLALIWESRKLSGIKVFEMHIMWRESCLERYGTCQFREDFEKRLEFKLSQLSEY
jgi:hypothetical protein